MHAHIIQDSGNIPFQ